MSSIILKYKRNYVADGNNLISAIAKKISRVNRNSTLQKSVLIIMFVSACRDLRKRVVLTFLAKPP